MENECFRQTLDRSIIRNDLVCVNFVKLQHFFFKTDEFIMHLTPIRELLFCTALILASQVHFSHRTCVTLLITVDYFQILVLSDSCVTFVIVLAVAIDGVLAIVIAKIVILVLLLA